MFLIKNEKQTDKAMAYSWRSLYIKGAVYVIEKLQCKF